jgi:hypothetical protein
MGLDIVLILGPGGERAAGGSSPTSKPSLYVYARLRRADSHAATRPNADSSC